MVELSAAMNVSVHIVQNSFQEELGCLPMLELKQMRPQRLRKFLLDPSLSYQNVAKLMEQASLLTYGATVANYHRCFASYYNRCGSYYHAE